jgi:small conductance mechanosensitive channel
MGERRPPGGWVRAAAHPAADGGYDAPVNQEQVDTAFQNLISWLGDHGVALAAIAIVVLVVFRIARPAIHRVVVRLIRQQAATLGEEGAPESEVDRRVETIEDALTTLLKIIAAIAIVLVLFGAFDLWPVLAGLGLVFAAITLAGQSIVLDYLMGILILVEGQYFKGDFIRVGSVEGTVEELGLRRTVVRDVRGTLHSISNGEIRIAANLTRTYAVAMIEVEGIAEADVERTIAVMNQIGQDLQADEKWKPRFLEAPRYRSTIALRANGATLRMAGRIQPEFRVQGEAEIRRRVATGLAAAGIEPNRTAMVSGGP